MMQNIFTKSDKFTSEYCISIVRIGEVKPIENSDFLGQTIVNGESIVVRKDQVSQGDVLFYSSNETELCARFLAINNLYEWGERHLNSNYEEVEKVKAVSEEQAKRMVGFFNKRGRVRMIKLRGVPSMGYLFGMSEMTKYCPKAKDIDLEKMVGEDFDEVDGERFVKAYIPYRPPRGENGHSQKHNKYLRRRVESFDRIVKGQFQFHYSTSPLPKCINSIQPTDTVVVSVKLHGASAIFANVKVKNPKKLAPHKWLLNKFIDLTGWLKKYRVIDYTIDYGNIYSSRTVIKNQYLNKNPIYNFYGTDIWGEYNELMKDYIPQGMTIYGEICGYITGSRTMIQKDYDYGCEEGKNFLMPYRITTTHEDGTKTEWSVREVQKWTENLIKEFPDLKERVHPIPILYEGTLADLYPDIPQDEHWNENILEALRNDKKTLGMELKEPLCKNKVPREGIVLRINDDPIAEAFKLKSKKFMDKERKLIDSGEVDMEMADGLDVENNQSKEDYEVLKSFANKMLTEVTPIDEEIQEDINNHFWDLM